jgi:hypothetical protein
MVTFNSGKQQLTKYSNLSAYKIAALLEIYRLFFKKNFRF